MPIELEPDPREPIARPDRRAHGEFASASAAQLAALRAVQFPGCPGVYNQGQVANGLAKGGSEALSTRTVWGPVRLMIDTVHVTFPILVTRPVVGGWRVRHDQNGHFDWEVNEDAKIEGTWGTNILVTQVSEDGHRVSTEQTDRNAMPEARRVYRQFVKVMGSPTKHATGQNAFGTDDLEALVLYFIELLRGHPHVYEVDEMEVWRSARLTKLDIAGVVAVDPRDKLWLLDYISKHAVVSGKQKQINGVLRGNTTWYSHYAEGTSQVRHQLKIYSKVEDIQKPEKRGGVRRDLFYYGKLCQDAAGWLRIERALHTRALKSDFSDSPVWWNSARLVDAWERGVAAVSWPDFTRGDVHKVIGDGVLTPGAMASFYGWLAGDDPFGQAKIGMLSRGGLPVAASTLRLHRKQILKASNGRIDIKNPRPVEQRAEVVRIVRVGEVKRPEYLAGLPMVA